MACLSEIKDVFTFTWQIENFSMYAQQPVEFLTSPIFIVDGLQKSSWELQLYPRSREDNECISLFLKRCGPAQSNENKIALEYTLELYGSHSSEKPSKADIIEYEFARGDGFGCPALLNRSAISNDIPGDVLTARCCMWLQYKEDNPDDEKNCTELNLSPDNIKDLDGMKEMLAATSHDLAAFKYRFSPIECCARTHIKVERMSIVCPISNFCKDKSMKRMYLPIMSAMNCPSFILTVEEPDGDDWVSIKIQRIADINSQHFVTGKITAFHSKKSPVLFQKDDYLFKAQEQNDKWLFANFIKTNTTWNELVLSCEFAISTRGNENHTYEENKILVECKTNQSKIETFSGLGNNFQDFYKCRSLPDVVLTCEQHIYNVHKAVLLANSKRFVALLEDENSLEIKDLQPSLLNEMLMFMYHVKIQNLKEKASDLYSAAYKYQIESLKQKCSSVLKSELSVSNVCKNLALADTYKDFDLFSEIQNFIHDNAKEVFESHEWLNLSEKNPKLALNISQKVLKQNMNI